MTVRDEAHRLIDAVPEEQLPDAVEMLRQWASLPLGTADAIVVVSQRDSER
jgi:hypothetical protein